MKPKSFMLIAGEASGDALAAELVSALRARVLRNESVPTNDVQPLRTELVPRFFGAGGPRMASAGVELAFDMTKHSVIGFTDALKEYWKFRKLFNRLLKMAFDRQPDAIIGVDFGGFNLRFGHAIRQHVRRHLSEFTPWNPKLIQFVSPQVWASRPGRTFQIAEDYDLLLSIFPFEKAWYAKRVPKLRVEFVGHPMFDREETLNIRKPETTTAQSILLLPGSRIAELRRHLPVMSEALKLIQAKQPGVRSTMVLPNASLSELAASLGTPRATQSQVGNLPGALMMSDVAIASTGTVTMECAHYGVPSVTLYKTSAITWELAKRLAKVKWATMPNLLANEEVFPEFLQNAATPESIAGAALELLENRPRRERIKGTLARIISSLGGPGASRRAAEVIVSLMP